MPLLLRRRPTASRLPARTSPRNACPPFDSAGRERLQPAAQLGHVQGHGHENHVLRALRACPGPQALSGAFPVHAACAAAAHAPPPPGALLAPYRMPSFRLGSKRTRSTSRSALTRPRSRTCAPCSSCAPRVPWPSSVLPGLSCACRLRRRPTASRLPARTSPRIVRAPPFDSAEREGVQPAAQL